MPPWKRTGSTQECGKQFTTIGQIGTSAVTSDSQKIPSEEEVTNHQCWIQQ